MKLKRVLYGMLICTLILCNTAVSFAESQTNIADQDASTQLEQEWTTTSNEYDVFMKLQNTSKKVLKQMGYTTNEVEKIKELSIEEMLLERAKLSEEELISKGYSREEIGLLKNYDGSPIANSPEMRGVFADITGTVKKIGFSKSTAKAQFAWEWSKEPVLSGTPVTEVVTCNFLGINTNNQTCVVTNTLKSCSVKYYNGTMQLPSDEAGPAPKPTVTKQYSQVSVKFPMGKVYGGGSYWAKKGTFTVEVSEQAVVNKLHTTAFLFCYGHPTLKVTAPEIEVSLSFKGLEFKATSKISAGAEIMLKKGLLVHRDGSSEPFPADL